jgi:hypothetical protein
VFRFLPLSFSLTNLLFPPFVNDVAYVAAIVYFIMMI